MFTPLELRNRYFQKLKNTQSNEISGIFSGFNDLDSITNGFQPSDLILIGGLAGMGKTAFALSLIANLTQKKQIPTGFISLELSSELIMMKMITQITSISLNKLKECNLNTIEMERIYEETKVLEKSPLFIIDYPILTFEDIRNQALELVSNHKIKILIIEELHLIATSEKEKIGKVLNKVEITDITAQLKELAKELEIPIVVFVNMKNEKPWKRPNWFRPMLSDLRKLGAIELYADLILFLYRPEYFKMDEWDDEIRSSTAGEAEIIVAKNRHRKLANVRVKFCSKKGFFEN